MQIHFNQPYLTGDELPNIQQAVAALHLSGNGLFTKACQQHFETAEYWGGAFGKCLLTTSCTDALEMAALLLDMKAGDEVILPSYTFVSTANAFVLRGATLRFADSMPDFPNISVESIKNLISEKTKAIVVVHYAGVACAMDEIMALANAHHITVIEDAAQAVDATYKGRWLGSIGHLAAFSFHETKNIHCGEGGMLVVNEPKFAERAEILWEKGTNRSAFFRGEIARYNWQDVGSSFLPSELNAAFLFAQLQNLPKIQAKRRKLWQQYDKLLAPLASEKTFRVLKPHQTEANSKHNAHIFAICVNDLATRTDLLTHLKNCDIHAIFHYVSLHNSPFMARYQPETAAIGLPNCEHFENTLIRLPLFVELKPVQVQRVCEAIKNFYQIKNIF
ncbi:MAG: hypothetical protein RL757_929 [Bacteroidota bacterium]